MSQLREKSKRCGLSEEWGENIDDGNTYEPVYLKEYIRETSRNICPHMYIYIYIYFGIFNEISMVKCDIPLAQ